MPSIRPLTAQDQIQSPGDGQSPAETTTSNAHKVTYQDSSWSICRNLESSHVHDFRRSKYERSTRTHARSRSNEYGKSGTHSFNRRSSEGCGRINPATLD